MPTLSAISVFLAQNAPPADQGDDGSSLMVYAIIAFGLAIALLVLEAFIPSGGVLGILSGVLAIGGIFLFFRYDTTWGLVSMGVTLISLPFVLAGMLWLWPNTPIGRALTLMDKQERSNDEEQKYNAEKDPDAIAVGLEGEALSELRPVGACRLKGKRIDCISQRGVIEPGTKVKVVSVEGTTIKVKAV